MTKYNNNGLRGLLGITGAISDETRIRILMMLDLQELCVCQITDALELAPSTISKHLSILENADLISRRKVGRWVYYKLNNAQASSAVVGALKLVKSSARKSKNIVNDRGKIKALLKEDTIVICKRLYHGEEDIIKSTREKNGRLVKA